MEMSRVSLAVVFNQLDDIEDFIMENSNLSYDKIADRLLEEFGMVLEGEHLRKWFKFRGIQKIRTKSTQGSRVTKTKGFVMY